MKKNIIFLFSMLFVVSLSAQTPLEEAVDINVKTIQGDVYSLFDILDSGKYVVIDFYSTNCGYCQIYAPDVQQSYENFGSNTGDVFFMTIDKGHNNAEVWEFDEIYGVTMPSVSGTEGGGNMAHMDFMIAATPSVVLIAPDYIILEQMIWPPSTENIDAALINAGLQMTDIDRYDDSGLMLFPNPTSDVINITINDQQQLQYFYIMNVSGEVIKTGDITQQKIDVSDLPQGVYFLGVKIENFHPVIERVIISK